jgi:hypothetical protein
MNRADCLHQEGDSKGKKGRILWILLLLLYVLYAGAFIYRTSFVVEGKRYFNLFDDAMISMRYAKNLAQGHGLVWNPGGERVEGFSNPLWVFFMAAFHLLPVAPAKISLLIQISGALFLILNLYLVRKIANFISGNSLLVSLGAAALTAFYLPLNNWSLQGMEVSALTLLLSLALWKTLKLLETDEFSLGLYILLGSCTLIRLDMVVPYLSILTYLALVSRRQRWKNLGWGLLILAVFIGLQTLARFMYYHELLPNTYFLKMTGYPLLLRLSRGIYAFLMFVYHFNWLLFLLPLAVLFFRRDRVIGIFFWIILGQVLYSIWVGGDAWDWWGGSNRYISIAMPAFFVMFACTLQKVGNLFRGLNVNGIHLTERLISWGLVAFLFFSMLNFNILGQSGFLRNWLLLDTPLWEKGNEMRVKEALLLTRITDPQATIAVTWAGTTPYFADRQAVDILGKNDRVIAREKMRTMPGWSGLTYFVPGHLKWNYRHSFGKLKPDVIVQMWWNKEEAALFLKNDYIKKRVAGLPLFFRKNSPHVLWDKL